LVGIRRHRSSSCGYPGTRTFRGGRPPVLDEKDKAAAIALFRDPNIPVKEVARRLGISVAALYHHFPGGRGAMLQNATNRT
jgi:AcrR family transcriptional regulator